MNALSQAGRIVLSVPLALGIIAFVAFRWNTTHVFNAKWHPHARFHAVQLGLFFIALSGIGFWLIWGSAIGLPTAAWLAAQARHPHATRLIPLTVREVKRLPAAARRREAVRRAREWFGRLGIDGLEWSRWSPRCRCWR